jgi:hypothetical protein
MEDEGEDNLDGSSIVSSLKLIAGRYPNGVLEACVLSALPFRANG